MRDSEVYDEIVTTLSSTYIYIYNYLCYPIFRVPGMVLALYMNTVIMREMAPGANGFLNISRVFLRTPVPSHRWVPSHAYLCDNAIK